MQTLFRLEILLLLLLLFVLFFLLRLSFITRRYIRFVLSKLIRQRIEDRFKERHGTSLRYSKQCDALAAHIQEVCKTNISPSTLRRLLGFVKNSFQPREYSLDILAEYVGYKSWTHLLKSLEHGEGEEVKVIEKLKPTQVKSGQTVRVSFEPGRQVSIKKENAAYHVVASNEKKLLSGDEVEFRVIELHYPLTFTRVVRGGRDIGRVQVATFSGVTSITKE